MKNKIKIVVIGDTGLIGTKVVNVVRQRGHVVVAAGNIKPWRLNAPKVPTAGWEALMDAVDAHLIVLVGRHAESPPFWLREWLTPRATIRQIPDAAPAVIGSTDGGLSRPATPELPRFVRQHGLTFVGDEDPVAKDSVKLFIRYSRERKSPLPVVRSRLVDAVTQDSYRGRGASTSDPRRAGQRS